MCDMNDFERYLVQVTFKVYSQGFPRYGQALEEYLGFEITFSRYM
jgi:hypothetical protein